MEKRARLHLIDALRGFTVISMVAYHFMYDVMIVYGHEPGWYAKPQVFFWQQCICWSFIIISGFVWPWGKSRNLRRGIVINLWGLVITAVSAIALPSEAIWFGVLSFLGCAVLLLIPLEKPLGRLDPWLGLALSFLLFWLFRHTASGFLGIPGLFSIKLPTQLYSSSLLAPLGFPAPSFRSSDYFPLLPWFFLYLCGYFINRIFSAHPAWEKPLTLKIPLLGWIGKKALVIYVLHQPVCMGICMLLFG